MGKIIKHLLEGKSTWNGAKTMKQYQKFASFKKI